MADGSTNCYAMKLAGTRLRHQWSREGLTTDTNGGPAMSSELLDALRPFAAFALEARLSDNVYIVTKDGNGNETARLTAEDFRRAHVAYCMNDTLSMNGLIVSLGRSVAPKTALPKRRWWQRFDWTIVTYLTLLAFVVIGNIK